jgi:hypothetical protein
MFSLCQRVSSASKPRVSGEVDVEEADMGA